MNNSVTFYVLKNTSMKTFTLFALAAATLLPCNSHAQDRRKSDPMQAALQQAGIQNGSRLNLHREFRSPANAAQLRTSTVISLLDSALEWEWNSSLSTWDFDHRFLYTYGSSNEQLTFSVQNRDSAGWINGD